MTEHFVNYCNCICQSVTCSCAKLDPINVSNPSGADLTLPPKASVATDPIISTSTLSEFSPSIPHISSVHRILEILEHLHHVNFEDAMKMFFNEHKPVEEIFKEVWSILPEHLKLKT